MGEHLSRAPSAAGEALSDLAEVDIPGALQQFLQEGGAILPEEMPAFVSTRPELAAQIRFMGGRQRAVSGTPHFHAYATIKQQPRYIASLGCPCHIRTRAAPCRDSAQVRPCCRLPTEGKSVYPTKRASRIANTARHFGDKPPRPLSANVMGTTAVAIQ